MSKNCAPQSEVEVVAEEPAMSPQVPETVESQEVDRTQIDKPLASCVQQLGINCLDRHLLLCTDPTKPKCCPPEVSLEAWDYLKKRLKELGLDRPTEDETPCVFRTKADCLRVCFQGPILVVYPDGVWYRNATPPVIERIVQEHLLGDRIVEEYAFATHPLPDRPSSAS